MNSELLETSVPSPSRCDLIAQSSRVASAARAPDRSCLEIVRHLAAARRKLGHDLLVQPDVHGCGVVRVAGVAQLLGEVLARGEAAVEIEQLHQVDDRAAPIELLLVFRGALRQHGLDVDLRDRRIRRRGRWFRRRCTGGGAWRRRCGRTCRRCLFGFRRTEDRVLDLSEDAHGVLLQARVEPPDPKAPEISASVAFSASLTATPPKPRNPPSLPASAAFWATSRSHALKGPASCGVFWSRSAETARNSPIAFAFTSGIFAPLNCDWMCCCTAVHVAGSEKPSATAFTSGLAC